MSFTKRIAINYHQEISAIYYALLQCGYDFYFIERSLEHTELLRGLIKTGTVPAFFSDVKQYTCKKYPYWPRAAMLEAATLYLDKDNTQFRDYDTFHKVIMSATNIVDAERNDLFWNWIKDFPAALNSVLLNDCFHAYLKWEGKWISEQNAYYEKELLSIQKCLDVFVNRYGSPVQDIQIIIDPIKCVYSSDYHLVDSKFVFCSGAFRFDSVIHEFLHHVIHPYVIDHQEMIIERKPVCLGIDDSYHLSGDNAGMINAFEEHLVRTLTTDIIANQYPQDISIYLERLCM